MNKRGWLRIVEAFLAVIIIISTVLVLMVNTEEKEDVEQIIYEKQNYILEIINKNDSLRQKVLDENEQDISNFIFNRVPNSWGFAVKICEIEDICNTETPNDKNIYVSEILVISSLAEYNPQKLRFFVWMK